MMKANAYPVGGNWRAGIETGGPTEILRSTRGIARTFRTRAAAMAAAQKEISARLYADADALKRRPLPVPHVAARLLSGVTMPKNPLTIWRQPRN